MEQLKESGIEWIGDIPKNWAVHPVFTYFFERKKKNTNCSERNLLSLSYGTIKRKNIDSNNGLLPKNFSSYNIVECGDIVIRPTDLQNDKKSLRTGLVTEKGIITSAYITLCPLKNVNSRYFHYLLHSYDVQKVFYNMGNGVRQCLNYSEFSKLLLLAPTLIKQEKIANYLDSKCSEIDSLVADIQKEISILEEYKMSVVTESVTRGIKPNVELKNSGLDWINKIPKEWSKSKIKYLFRSEKGLSITKDNLVTDGIPVINYGQIHSKENTRVSLSNNLLRYIPKSFIKKAANSKVNQYDFVFADTSEDYEGCGNCVYKRDDSINYAGYHTIVLHSINSTDNRYYAYLFSTDLWRKQIRTKVSGIKVLSITQQILLNSTLILPTSKEQNEIADYLDNKCTEIDKTISEKQSQLEILAEYKKSIIYEYVTGKKEVI